MQATACYYFRQEAAFRLSRLTESASLGLGGERCCGGACAVASRGPCFGDLPR
jgi:hypothetical protein